MSPLSDQKVFKVTNDADAAGQRGSMGPWGPHRPKISPGDAVQEVPVHKATVIRSKSLFCFFGVETQVFQGFVVSLPPPG